MNIETYHLNWINYYYLWAGIDRIRPHIDSLLLHELLETDYRALIYDELQYLMWLVINTELCDINYLKGRSMDIDVLKHIYNHVFII